jgi:hypothetical protein
MVRAGVSLVAVMKLLGHLKPEMTLHYVEVPSWSCSASSIWPSLSPAIARPRFVRSGSLGRALSLLEVTVLRNVVSSAKDVRAVMFE